METQSDLEARVDKHSKEAAEWEQKHAALGLHMVTHLGQLQRETEDAKKTVALKHEAQAEAEGALRVAEQEKAQLLTRVEAMSQELASTGTSTEAARAAREGMERELEETREALARAEAAACSVRADADAARKLVAEKHEAETKEAERELQDTQEALRQAEESMAKVRADAETSCDKWERTCAECSSKGIVECC